MTGVLDLERRASTDVSYALVPEACSVVNGPPLFSVGRTVVRDTRRGGDEQGIHPRSMRKCLRIDIVVY